MTSTPVGMRCPECARQRTQVRNPTGAAGRSDAPVTYAVIAVCVVAFLAEMVSGGASGLDGGGKLIREGGLFAGGVADGEWYRIITSAFLHAGLLHLGFNMFALYILGTLLEPAIGSLRFAGIYVASILAGSLGVLVINPDTISVGASGGIFGLMAAAFLIARDRGLDELASQIGFFVVLNLAITFTVPNISIGAHIGGLIGGVIASMIVIGVDRRGLPNGRRIELGVLVALCAVAFVGSLLAADANAPAALGA
jgi:membrane associated rhomboid family serine protease